MGGSFAVVWVTTFTWSGWQASVEYASNLGWRYACLLGYTFHTGFLARCHLITLVGASLHGQERLS